MASSSYRELVIIKPDGVERKLVGEIISVFEKAGFTIENLQKTILTNKIVKLLYRDTEEQLIGMGEKTIKSMEEKGELNKLDELFGTRDPYKIGKQLIERQRKFMTSGPVIVMILDKENAPVDARKIVGSTDPSKAEKGTIRGDFGNDSIYTANGEKRAVHNLVHASDPENAEYEINIFERYVFKN